MNIGPLFPQPEARETAKNKAAFRFCKQKLLPFGRSFFSFYSGTNAMSPPFTTALTRFSTEFTFKTDELILSVTPG